MIERGGVRILIVDDDPSIVGMIRTRLEKQGYRVFTAADGEAAVEIALDERPDLVVLDVMMPKMSGWEVARTLRGNPDVAGIKIVLLTAIGKGMNDLTAPLYDVDAHLDKPFEFKDLEATIERLIAR
ncbi:MAG TPA: response regulator [Kofleriaceae bacterium]|nr:response regulator [Kofleriaceae bacterium]